MDSLNLKNLRSSAKENGFCCYWKTDKATLVNALSSFKQTNKIPQQFVPKQKIGQSCDKSEDCRSKKCNENKCIGSKKVKSGDKKVVNAMKEVKEAKKVKKVKKAVEVLSRTSSSSSKSSPSMSIKKMRSPSKPKSKSSVKKSDGVEYKLNNKNVTRTSTTFTKDGKMCKSVCTTRCKI
jgi:hypothetical protein